MADVAVDYRQLPRRTRRRLVTVALLRSVLTSAVIVIGYFLMPMRLDGSDPVGGLVLGLAVVGFALGWQIAAISRAKYPRIRAVGAMATLLPLFLVVFATSYYLMATTEPSTFSEPLDRLDAMYFSMTVFATVGFGDIAPVSEAARAVTTIQMAGDIVLVGLVARILLGVANQRLDQRK